MVHRSFSAGLTLGLALLLGTLLFGAGARGVYASGGDPSVARGAINKQINYQGKLMTASGLSVPNGTYQMEFAIYAASSGGTALWNASGTSGVPTKIPVTVNDGLFTVLLGDTSSDGGWQNAFSNTMNWDTSSLYIGITVGTDAEMTPRKRIGAVPQAFNAAQLQGMNASGTASGRDTLFIINRTDTGTSPLNPRSALDVRTAGTDASNDYIARFQNTAGSTDYVSIRNDGFLLGKSARFISGAAGATFWGQNTLSSPNAWSGHFSSLLIGARSTTASFVNGADLFEGVVSYAGSQRSGLCLDNSETGTTCTYTAGVSMKAEGAINASAFNVGSFDLAEMYSISGEVEPGDLLSVDPENPMLVKRSSGIPYDNQLVGIVSTQPGFILGDIASGTKVALAGRVPTKVSTMNGEIAVGDLLTSSPIPGVAMKATAPGRVVGYALQAASGTSTIEVFVKVGYDASSFLQTEAGKTLAQGDLIMNATHTASALEPAASSWGITWRGSVWDGLQALKKEFTLRNDRLENGQSAFRLTAGTSTVWSVDEQGSMQVGKDLSLGGKFFPGTRTGAQSDKYIFLDDSGSPSSTYIATNADGWQANTSYDFAERYYSPDALEPGDVVLLSQQGQFHVQKTLKQGDVPIGIVSTRPAFIAGAPGPSTFPIALAGRVPTKVSTQTGVIAVGDPLTASSLPGVVVKAVQAGPIVGYALESYSAADVGKIEVFVNAGWWGGSAVVMNESKPEKVGLTIATTTALVPKSYQGVARILAGAMKVKVVHPSLGTFPLIQVTPYGKVDAQWWTDNSSDRGFEIILKQPLTSDTTFSWRAEEMLPTDDKLFLSNDQPAKWDIYGGQPVLPIGTTPPPEQAETLPDVTSTPVIVQETATTTATAATTTPSVPVETPTTSTPEDVTPPAATTSSDAAPAPTPEPVAAPVVSPLSEELPAPAPTPVESAPAPEVTP